ncbi:hypothetical protein F5Y16DRAFT_230513 [Xylariaceae sp. FL0255]|nr:hypothetical protein F5Y16DRAFT_230513 [Xylariaceae sp. FL0255]
MRFKGLCVRVVTCLLTHGLDEASVKSNSQVSQLKIITLMKIHGFKFPNLGLKRQVRVKNRCLEGAGSQIQFISSSFLLQSKSPSSYDCCLTTPPHTYTHLRLLTHYTYYSINSPSYSHRIFRPFRLHFSCSLPSSITWLR